MVSLIISENMIFFIVCTAINFASVHIIAKISLKRTLFVVAVATSYNVFLPIFSSYIISMPY